MHVIVQIVYAKCKCRNLFTAVNFLQRRDQ